MREQWFVANKKADFAAIARKFNIEPVTARIIRNRGIVGDNEIYGYLHGGLDMAHPPGGMLDMEKGAAILAGAIREKKKVRVVSDYDVDGCCSGYILVKALEILGGDADFDIPRRTTDGYGLNERIVQKAFDEGVSIILTCDNGISALPAAELAKSLGISVIVTDHHDIPFAEGRDGEKAYILPPADAIINPKRPGDEYPFKHLCGAGVAYKLAQALFGLFGRSPMEIPGVIELLALATLCDVVELTGENRIFVREGLKLMEHTENTGLKALISVMGIIGRVGAYHAGFILGPAINASGRLETAEMAIRLFLSRDEREAEALAEELKKLNSQRKDMTVRGIESAAEIIEKDGLGSRRVIMVYLEECHESVAGIIAGRIREKYCRPVFVVTRGAGGELKASGRSVEAYNMFHALSGIKELLLRFGGHPMAAGMSFPEENLDRVREALVEGSGLSDLDLIPRVLIDLPLRLEDISEKLINEISLLEPFGKGNPKPLFAEKGLIIKCGAVLGKDKNVVKLKVENPKGVTMDALFFGGAEVINRYMKEKFGTGALSLIYRGRGNVPMDLVYYPVLNRYMGRKSIEIIITNFR